MQMPDEMGPVHILGIGGIGMSAIAEILHAKGYTVQGSDQKDSVNVRRLPSNARIPSSRPPAPRATPSFAAPRCWPS